MHAPYALLAHAREYRPLRVRLSGDGAKGWTDIRL